jgi:hypothetical protein
MNSIEFFRESNTRTQKNESGMSNNLSHGEEEGRKRSRQRVQETDRLMEGL